MKSAVSHIRELSDITPEQVRSVDVIFVSHSGGKDSQAMLAKLIRLGFRHKIVIVHADLGEMEWEPMHQFIEKNSFGLPVFVVKSEMDFFEMVRKYKRLPSGQQQFCTDFLKIKPIGAFIHDYMSKNGLRTAINCTGMRGEESKRREAKLPFTLSQGAGTSGIHQPRKYPEHTIYDWLPILDYKLEDVLAEVKNAGQEIHKVYGMGFSRLSCVFCVNGRISEHQKASELRPELARKIADLEREVGRAYRLKQVKGVKTPKYFDEYLTALC